MKHPFFRVLLVLCTLTFSSFAYADACNVAFPKDFSAAFETLSKGGCSRLTFKNSMDIILEKPLVLDKQGSPISIVASDSATVRLIGWKGSDKSPGLTIKRDQVLIQNILFRDFPGSALHLEGNDIQIVKSEIAQNGLNGIEISDSQDLLDCSQLSFQNHARNILLQENDIHHNANYGVLANGYQTNLFSSQIHHNTVAGVFIQGDSRYFQCKKEGESFDPLKILHTFNLSKVSFFENGPKGGGVGVQTQGPVFPSPAGVVGVAGPSGDVTVSGHIPLSPDPKEPWSLGRVNPADLQVEIYAGLPGDGDQGRTFVGMAEKVSANGDFQTLIPKKDLPEGKEILLTAVAKEPLLKISSGFSMPALQGDAVDTDGDGIPDAQEDLNQNGKLDFGETDPRNPDTDSDGVTDGVERQMHLDPNNPDTDGDCIPDGVEMGITKDQILELRKRNSSAPKNLVLPQSCIDKAVKSGATKPANALFSSDKNPSWQTMIAMYDEDPTTKTDPLNADTDSDHLKEGEEDKNLNGKKEEKETDPANADTDHDELSDGDEILMGTDPLNPDTDGDGATDGFEALHLKTDPKKCDTDGDGLGDGLEAGIIHPKAVTPECRGLQKAGTNFHNIHLLNPLDPDSDHDGIPDGVEDANHNGWLDYNETDPTNPDTDGDGLNDGLESLTGFDLTHLSNGERCSPPTNKLDVDCDGTINARDDDSDNDGCPDSEEGTKDTNNDGIPDVWQADVKACTTPAKTNPSSSPSMGGGNSAKPAPSESPTQKNTSSSEVLPAKGGGFCQLVVLKDAETIAQKRAFLCLALLYSSVIFLRGLLLLRKESISVSISPTTPREPLMVPNVSDRVPAF